jgi:hypothetical protein
MQDEEAAAISERYSVEKIPIEILQAQTIEEIHKQHSL